MDPLLPPPSPGPLQNQPKVQKATSAPARQAMPEMQFPPPSPVAVQPDPPRKKRTQSPVPQPEATTRKKRTHSPVPGAPVRKVAGLVPLLLPPPSPIAKPPGESQRRSPRPTAAEATGAVGSSEGGVSADTAAVGVGSSAPEDVSRKDTARDDSMLDKIDLD